MDHTQYYRRNTAYAEILATMPLAYYQKYIDHMYLRGGRVLDVGCGIGPVVQALALRGSDAYGIDPCEPAVEQARRGAGTYVIGESTRLPFPDASFAVVGSFMVLEHLADPEAALSEMVRVLQPGGRLVVACPNFLRVAGLMAHHQRTRGRRQQLENMATLLRKMVSARLQPARMAFDHMPMVVRPDGFAPDDDAITVTNAVDIKCFLRPHVRVTYHSGMVTYGSARLERLAELPLVRTLIGGVFLVGVRRA